MQLYVALILILFISLFPVNCKDVKVYRRGKVSLIDETQFKNPHDYSFDDDQDAADLENAYDEKVPYLPKYILHKNGFDQGYTRVPIVTRKGSNTWSTPRPTTLRGEEYKTWGTPKILPVTKPTPSHPDIVRTTPVPKTTFIAKFPVAATKAEKPAKKPELKSTKSSSEESTTKKPKFTRKPSTTTEATTEAPSTKKQQFTRKPTTTSTEKSKEVSQSRETFARRPPTSSSKSSSVETTTEEFSTTFYRKGSKTTTPVSAEDSGSTKRKQFTRRPSTTTSASTEETTSKKAKAFTRRPASTEASTETSKEAKKKFTRRPTTTQATTEASTETSTRRKFTRRPTSKSIEASTESSVQPISKKFFTRRPTSTSASTETSSEATKKKFFTRRPTTTSASTESSSEATQKKFFTRKPTASASAESTTRRAFTRRPKITTTEATTEATTTTMLPLRERLRPTLTTREPTPTMPRKFRVFTNIPPAEPPTEELNPQQQIEMQRKLKEKLKFGNIVESTNFATHPVAIPNGHVEQTVRSNAIVLQPQKNRFFLPSHVTSNPSIFSPSTASTQAPKVVHRWQSSWSSWSSWDANGRQVTGSTKTFRNLDDETTTTTPTPQRTRTETSETTRSHSTPRTRTQSSVPSTRTTASRRRPFRPPIIHHQKHRYRGPTYNCRVLTPIEDGRPSPHTDPSCRLKYPGFPADDTCKCTYEVEARDDHGCATGFLYTCKQIARRT